MSLARFFDRTYAAAGRALSVSRESLEVALQGRTVGVACGPETTSNDNARWIATLSVNLLSRMFSRLSLYGPSSLITDLSALARSINPAIELMESPEDVSISLCLGSPPDLPPHRFFAGATGWVAHVQHDSPAPLGAANPYSSAAAACLSVARVFRTLFATGLPTPVEERDSHLSLLDFGSTAGSDEELPKTDLGDVALFGLGAVGNGAAWTLSRHARLSGRLWLVDPETVELSNLQRYVLTTDTDVGRQKTELVRQELGSSPLCAEERPLTLEAFADQFLEGFSVPTVLVSVDNVLGRRTAQALLPRLVVNGWTGDGSLGASWHTFDSERACLACLYQPGKPLPSQTELVASALGLPHERAAMLWVGNMPPSASELEVIAKHLGLSTEDTDTWRGRPLRDLYRDVICGAVALDVRGLGNIETVPLAHQSALAGALAAAELVKRCVPALASRAQRDPLIVWDDVLRSPPTTWTQPRPRVRGCICSDADYQAAFAAKWTSSPTPD